MDASFQLRHNLGEEAIYSMMHVPSSSSSSPAGPPAAAPEPFPKPSQPLYPPFRGAPHPHHPHHPGYAHHYHPGATSPPATAETGALSAEGLRSVVRSALREMLHSEGWAREEGWAGEPGPRRTTPPLLPSAAEAAAAPTLVPAGRLLSSAPAPVPASPLAASASSLSSSSSSLVVWGIALLSVSLVLLLAALLVVWRVMRTSAKRRRALPDDAVGEVVDVLARRNPDRLSARVWVRQILGEIRKRSAGRRDPRTKGSKARRQPRARTAAML